MNVDIEHVRPSATAAAELFPPILIGPTWQTNEDGSWLLPEHTLGWQILGWVAEELTNPDGGPWMATGEQARFILWFYAIDNNGDFCYRQGVLQRCKGWGKDPVAAVISIVELIGPSQFSHWTPDGEPKGKPNPQAHVQITAVSFDQTSNTTDLFPSLLPDRTRLKYRMDVQKQIIYANGGRNKLRAVGAAFRTAEGARVSFAVLNETHHWVPQKGGDKFYLTLKNNITKIPGRFLCITNAYEPGEDSVAQTIREEQEKVWAGLAKPSGWLYDSIEAHPESPLSEEWAPHIVNTIKGDAYWLNTDIIVQSLQDTSIPASTHRRMWFNQVVATADALISPGEWAGCLAEGMTGTKADLKPGDICSLGFDGSATDDATALVAIRHEDRLIVPLGVWQNPDRNREWHVPVSEVESEVHQAFASYDVRSMYCDLALWESYVHEWGETYRERLLIKGPQSAVGFDMRGNQQRVARGNEALVQTVVDGKIQHNGDKILRSHVLNCKRRRNRFGLIFGKESAESPRKVDAYAATLLAYMAMTDLFESGKKPKPIYSRKLIEF